MKTVAITMVVPVTKLAALQDFLTAEAIPADTEVSAERVAAYQAAVPVPEEPAVVAGGAGVTEPPEAYMAHAPKAEPGPAAEKKQITKTELRALGVELTKAGKQDELAAALGKFGAKKLSEVKESDYEALYKELGGK